MSKTIYLTTPLYYVNAAPHIGHSYTNIAADCLARYRRLKGEDVFLLTGTDEHGQKIAQAAVAAHQEPGDFVNSVVERFKALWKTLNISYDDFIRTTEPRHTTAVQEILTWLHKEEKLKRESYEGWYCTPCETFWTYDELPPPADKELIVDCPTCGRALDTVKEEGWHLPLREAQPWLVQFVKGHPDFIRPASRYNEIVSLLEQPLPESLCITRPHNRVSWGIEVPFDREHVVYVWFDALLNYITVPGYVGDRARFSRLWPADVHFIGKDILRHHAVYWPIMLHALGLPDDQMPKAIFAHGWWKIGEQKMSKSLGNIVDPSAVVGGLLKGQPHAVDVYRYFLLREIPFGQDGAFSEEAIFTRLSADLGNDLGNLVNRTLSMIERYCGGHIPAAGPVGCAVEDEPLRQAAIVLSATIEQAMAHMEFSNALEAIMAVVSQANRYIESQAPWKLAKVSEASRLHTVLNVLAEALRIVSISLQPFMPSVSTAIWQQLGLEGIPQRFSDAVRWPALTAGRPLGAHPVLFPRMEAVTSS